MDGGQHHQSCCLFHTCLLSLHIPSTNLEGTAAIVVNAHEQLVQQCVKAPASIKADRKILQQRVQPGGFEGSLRPLLGSHCPALLEVVLLCLIEAVDIRVVWLCTQRWDATIMTDQWWVFLTDHLKLTKLLHLTGN